VALAAQTLGIKAKIVIPVTTPAIKVDAVRARGATVVLHGDSFDEAAVRAQTFVKQEGMTFIHPFDDPDVIAGQGTVAMELVRQAPTPLDYVFICCGGGGLLAGMAAYLRYVWPQTRIIGVEPEDAACVRAALDQGRRVTLREVGLFADGCAVAQVGKEPFRLIKEYVDEVITVTTDEICAAVKDIFDDTRAIAEPAGALAVAGMKKFVEQREVAGCSMAATVSGANMNFDRLRYISERTEIGERREAILSVTIPERAGAFRAFCSAIGKRNITEFNYRYESADRARVFVGLTMGPGDEGAAKLQQTLQRKGYQVLNMTDNETAKLHLRHLIGGRLSSDIQDEMVFRVEFPERPGSLLHFLNALGKDYSITLFHYRNHGAAYGRILVGMQVPSGKRTSLRSALNRLGYRFWDETDNPAYREHLGRITT
jgi:threonine dehydratase